MKYLKMFLGALAILGTTAVQAAPTVWNWGGYVPTADTPVIGGAVVASTVCAQYGGAYMATCVAYYTDVRAFGTIAYTGTPTYGAGIGGNTNRYRGLTPGCPQNTAKIDMASGYVRPDTGAVWDGVYNGYAWTYLDSGSAVSFVCVKTDTY